MDERNNFTYCGIVFHEGREEQRIYYYDHEVTIRVPVDFEIDEKVTTFLHHLEVKQ